MSHGEEGSAADRQLATQMMWFVVAETILLLPILVATGITVHLNYSRWLVFRSRGIWYTRCLTWGPYAQIAVSLTIALTCAFLPWREFSPALLVLMVAEEEILIFMTAVVIARQLVLAIIFQTLPWQRKNPTVLRRMSPIFFLMVPITVSAIWLVVCQVPHLLAIFGVIPAVVSASLIYTATASLIVLYAVPAFSNRAISMSVFCDYTSNVTTFVTMVVLTIAVGCANSLYLIPQEYWLSNRTSRAVMYIFLVSMYSIYNFARPVWAVWRGDEAYLRCHEDAIRDVKLADPGNSPECGVNEIVMDKVTVKVAPNSLDVHTDS